MKRSWFSSLLLLGLPTLAAIGACDRQEWTIVDSVGIAGTPAFSGSSSFGGSSTAGFGPLGGSLSSGGVVTEPCLINGSVGGAPIFSAQVLNNQFPARAELFTLVSDEEASALRAGAGLISSVPDSLDPPELVRLLQLALPSATASRATLLQYLLEHFERSRSTWPNPWALRLVDHPATEHLNAVRIVLRDDAWIARIIDSSLAIVDTKNGLVGINDALAEPERIAAVYYSSAQSIAGGGLGACTDGHRTFALGNEAMVEEWSLGTSEILTRLDADLALLGKLFAVARPCPTLDSTPFNNLTACQAWPSGGVSTEYTAYQWALAWPVELYRPTAQNLANLSMALEADRFEPDPYIVSQAQGGAGGDAAAAGAGGAGSGEAGLGGVGSSSPGGGGT